MLISKIAHLASWIFDLGLELRHYGWNERPVLAVTKGRMEVAHLYATH
jgi:hypothetical protein